MRHWQTWLHTLLLMAIADGLALASQPATGPAGAANAVSVLTADGTTRSGVLEALSAEQAIVLVDGQPVPIPASALQEIQLRPTDGEPQAAAGSAIIRTRRGDRLAVHGVPTLAQGRLVFSTRLTGAAAMLLDAADAILFPEGGASAEKSDEALRKLSLPSGTDDYLVVRTDAGELVPVAGTLQGIAEGKVNFRYEDANRSIDLAKVVAMRIAPVGPSPKAGRGEVIGADGTHLVFDSVRLQAATATAPVGVGFGGRLALAGTVLGDLSIEMRDAATLLFQNENVIYLADLQPSNAEQAGSFDRYWPWKKNACSRGGPLRLGGRTYSRGLGLHSRCKLAWPLNGQYVRMVALAGIDESSPRGDAVLTVLADDKVLLEPVRLVGGVRPVPINLDIAEAKTLTILVDFGEALDVGDHVDLVEARLLKKSAE